MKKLLAVCFAALLSLTGCGNTAAPASIAPDASGSASADAVQIGLIQLVEHPSLDEIREAFVQGMIDSEIPYEIHYENGQGDMSILNTISQKFVSEKMDLIVAIATPAAQAAAAATSEIPIVFSAVTDPVMAGLVADLEHPDRNLTGTSDRIPTEQIFALADQLTPGIQTYGFLYNQGEDNSVSVIRDAKAVLEKKGVAFIETSVINSGEVTSAAQSLFGKVDAIFCPIDNTVAYAMPNLAQLAIEAKLPVYVAADSMVHDGGLATVGVNYTQLGKQTAEMAVEILEGKPVAEVPVQVLHEFATVTNAETAAALGVDLSRIAE